MKPRISLREALSDPNLLGSALAGDSWKAWRTLLIAAMGEELTADERAIFAKLTGREREPLRPVEEFLAVVGRRGGKSRALATFAAYISGLAEHPSLVPGERGVVLCIAPDTRQASIALEYCAAVFEQSPILRSLIVGRTTDSLSLSNGVDIEVRAASFRRLRGPTYVAIIADEAAFWTSEEWSSNPDREILDAVRPGLATTRGPLILASSPYARRGVLWQSYKRNFGPDGDPLVLVAKGATRDLNPSLPQSVIDRAYERDRAMAAAEYGAKFRTDLEAFVSMEAVEACVGDYREMAPSAQQRYFAFVDPSGGSSDSFTLAIGHKEGPDKRIVIDVVREVRPPFSPEAVIAEFAALCQRYRIHLVIGDRYAGEFPREGFAKFSIRYEPSAKPKSDLYRDFLALLNSGRVVLPKHEKLVHQLVGLERRTSRGGRDSIDHAPGGHDDLANGVAGVADVISSGRGGYNLDALAS
jgi:hypothetical protein